MNRIQSSTFTGILQAPLHFIKQLLLIGVLSVMMVSCLGPKKIDKWVSKHYDGNTPPEPKKKADFITISSSVPSTGERLSTTEKKTSHILPLLFYWQFDYRNTCTINPQVPVNNFRSAVLSYAANKGLKQKLNGQRIELSIEKIPNIFAIDDKGHVIWIIYAFGWDVLTIVPENSDMIVSYRVIKDGDTETKKGTITIHNTDKGLSLKMYQSLKKRTWQYLEQYDASISSMGKMVVDKIAAEL
jgi:hypothetical protein